jgi:hypothetical protein
MSVRRRQWRNRAGECRTAWIADYVDHGVRRITTFKRKSDALIYEAEARAGAHARPVVGLTVADLEARIAEKAAKFVEGGIEPVCYLYRHYNQTGDLIYAGVSLSPLRRNEKHVATAAWRQMLVKILIEPFITREEALAAERAAIREEFPTFNKVHNQRRHPAKELQHIEEETQRGEDGGTT